MNQKAIEKHLNNAIKEATPNVLEAILAGNYQQDKVDVVEEKVIKLSSFRKAANLIAACLVLLICVGGFQIYRVNYKVDSIIEFDVNPSIEFSISRSKKILTVEAGNQDALVILDQMELKGLDLTVGVNAIIGSMVKNGYLDELDSSILVTVSNSNTNKADDLRKELVTDIEASLAENKITATVYDQQVLPTDQLTNLAKEFEISPGKANFLKGLIEKDPTLNMAYLSSLSIAEITKLIEERNIDISDLVDYGNKVSDSLEHQTASENQAENPSDSDMGETTDLASSGSDTGAGDSSESSEGSGTTETSTGGSTGVPETTTEASKNKVKISSSSFSGGIIRVEFEGLVSWKNPTVSVRDSVGEHYPAMIVDTGDEYCDISVSGLKVSGEYTFSIGGIKNKKADQYETVSGDIYISVSVVIPPTIEETTTVPPVTESAADPTKVSETTAEKPAYIKSHKKGTDNSIELTFSKSVQLVDPLILVSDETGKTYVVTILDKKEKQVKFLVDGLELGRSYTVTIKGIASKETLKAIEMTAFLLY